MHAQKQLLQISIIAIITNHIKMTKLAILMCSPITDNFMFKTKNEMPFLTKLKNKQSREANKQKFVLNKFGGH